MSANDIKAVILDDGTTITLSEYVERMKAEGLSYLTAEDMANGNSGVVTMWNNGSLREVRVNDGHGVLQPGLYAVPDNAECAIDENGYILVTLNDGQETA